MGELGRIRAFEVTHGRKGTNNGWHPHYHFLQFCQVKADAAQLMDWRTRLYLRWDACCQRAGLGSPSFAHGIDLQDGRKADRYISKWGLEDELTRGHTKKGRAGGETPFDCARRPGRQGRPAGGGAFLEFSQCFKGKGNCPGQTGLRPVSTRLKRMTRRLHPKLSKTRSCWPADGAAVAGCSQGQGAGYGA